jgi:hypothetical protein
MTSSTTDRGSHPPACRAALPVCRRSGCRSSLKDKSAAVPETLQAIVSDAPSALAGSAVGADGASSGDPEPLLLPMPTNEEQQRILAQAQHNTGVTVQGPPGTGKSHTIANIISHYVAYGRRVLVVAEKEQALRALTDKIPDGIKDLTVSVLGADAGSRRELESAIGRIQTRVTAIDRAFADERIRQLTEDLDGVSRRIAVCTPGAPSVLVREIGPRQLTDVPRSEVGQLVKNLNLKPAETDLTKRTVLNAYGLIRLTNTLTNA